MVHRDQERAGLLVARPCRSDDTRLFGSAAAVDKFLHSIVGADKEFPRIAGRVADIRGIFHYDPLGGTLPQWQFVLARIFDVRAAVPDNMEGEDQPILIVDESWIDFVL